MGEIYKIIYTRTNGKRIKKENYKLDINCYDEKLNKVRQGDNKNCAEIEKIKEKILLNDRNDTCYYFCDVDKETIISFLQKNVRLGAIDSVLAWKIIEKTCENVKFNHRDKNIVLSLMKGKVKNKFDFSIDETAVKVIKGILKVVAMIFLKKTFDGNIDPVISTIVNELIDLTFDCNKSEIIKCCNNILDSSVRTIDDVVSVIDGNASDFNNIIRKIIEKYIKH